MAGFDRMDALKTVKQRVETLLQAKPRVLLGIDGRCASGKSTFAEMLAKELHANLIHMDDFFLRPAQRTAQRLAMPGENIDHERFLEEVLLPLSEGEEFCYRPFGCETCTLGEPVRVLPWQVSIVEGSYCFHKALAGCYDLKIFMNVEKEEQMRRLWQRNGDYARVFAEKWIPLEEAYFAAFSVERNCDLSF